MLAFGFTGARVCCCQGLASGWLVSRLGWLQGLLVRGHVCSHQGWFDFGFVGLKVCWLYGLLVLALGFAGARVCCPWLQVGWFQG